ncbi:MAG: marine proteobacterial sortase target protein [Xanthomonadales bacterium]|nr:marine proteobacterial sortase target protein [Xanthomonadales bacterium]
MKFSRKCLLALFALAAASSLQAQTLAGLQLVGDAGAVAAVTQSTEVDIRVTGLLARTTVTQRFTNHTQGWAEGRYVFPLPDGASVDELRITIGERIIEGEVREKADARRVFETARAQGQTAGLVEQHRDNLFSTSLTNIAPGEDIVVTIGFGQTVDYRHGRFTLRFPTTTLPRFENGHVTESRTLANAPPAPVYATGAPPRLAMTVDLAAGFDLAGVQSLHHAVDIRGRGSDCTIELAEPEHAAGRDFELVWSARDEDRLQGALFVEQMRGQAHALLMLLPPREFKPVALRRELILVIDRSGSMQGEAFEQAREAIRLALDRIDHDDRFNVIAFSNSALPLFDGPVAASQANLDRAYRFIEQLGADGGTEIDAAMGLAMAGLPDPGYLRQIVFATDGAVANEAQQLARIDREIDDSRLFAIGIGHGVNDAFLNRAARRGHGTTTLIKDPRDIAGRMSELLMQLESPVLEDLQIDWPQTGNTPAETWPERIPDLYAGQPLMVLARLDGPASVIDRGTVRATGLRDLRFVEMEWPMRDYFSAPGVARAWAQARIEGLADRPEGSMDAQLRHDERLLTALEYRIVSPLTSLVAVDRTPRRTEAAELRRVAVAGAAPADRDAAALHAMPATDAGSLEAGLRGLSILTIVLLMIFNRRFNRLERSRREAHADEADDTQGFSNTGEHA